MVSNLERRIIKTEISADAEHRLQIYERDDGLFSFSLDMRVQTYDGEDAWSPLISGPICDSVETAEREAYSRTEWITKTSN